MACTIGAALLALTALISGTGCARAPFGPFDLRNDSRHNGTLATELVLVPGVPFETNQNIIFRRADSSGRDFHMLIGPYPRLGAPAQITARNEEVVTVTSVGFVAAIGKQPIVITRFFVTSSSHTHYLCWAGPDNTDYVFAENATPGYPINLAPEPGATFAPAALLTGQFAAYTPATGLRIGQYFDPATPGSLSPGLTPELVDFITYVRSREVAAGMVSQDAFFRGIYTDGIPGLRPPRR